MIHPGFERVQKIIGNQKQRSQKEDTLAATIVRVMKVVGGYEQFLALPMPTYDLIVKGLLELDRLEAEKTKAMMGTGKKGARK